jgi:glycerol-3-phosphate acyltransferase PlsY
MELIQIILSIVFPVVGYFVGTINPGYFFGKMNGIDIRKEGRKNAGTSNTYHLLGLKYAVPTAFYDVFKGLLVIFFATLAGTPQFFALLSGIMAIVGHVFPFYMNFKGGQGVAAATGMLLFYIVAYLSLNITLLYFLIYEMILVGIFLYISRHGTLLALIVIPPFGYFIWVTYPGNPFNFFLWIILAQIVSINIYNVINRKTIHITDENFLGHKWRVIMRPLSIIFVVFYVIYSKNAALLFIGSVALVFILLDIIRFLHKQTNVVLHEKAKALFRKNEYQRFSSMTAFLVAFFITILVFPPAIAIAASTFLIFGDTFGKIFGLSFGKHKILDKTVEGTLAFYGCMMICGYVLYTLLNISPWILIVGGLSAPLIELFSRGLNDNITVPLFSGAIMYVVYFLIMGI